MRKTNAFDKENAWNARLVLSAIQNSPAMMLWDEIRSRKKAVGNQ
jgi:hypothetical protein